MLHRLERGRGWVPGSTAWELRHDLSGYDATYVALAEHTEASALLITDARLAKATGIRCPVQLL